MTDEKEVFTVEQQEGFIQEAIAFIGLSADTLEIKFEEKPEETLVHWRVKLAGYDYHIMGIYIAGELVDARASVIMTICLARHKFGTYVIDALSMAEKASHVDPKRNSLAEIFCRFLIKQAFGKNMPPAQVKKSVLTTLNFDQNFLDEQMFQAAFIRSPRKN